MKKRRLVLLAISLFIAVFSALLYSDDFFSIKFFEIVERRTMDLRFKFRGEIPPGSEVVLAVVDEKSVAKIGKWVWPRAILADLVNRLSDAGAKVIAFDICFTEPDSHDDQILRVIDDVGNNLVASGIQNPETASYLLSLKEKADNDGLLEKAVNNSKARVVLGHFFQMDPKELEHRTKQEVAVNKTNIETSKYKAVRYQNDMDAETPWVPEAVFPEANIDQIARSSEYSGYFNMWPDSLDGSVRHIPAMIKFDKNLYAPLSIMALKAYMDENPILRLQEDGLFLSVAGADVPLEETAVEAIRVDSDEKITVPRSGQIRINYRGRSKTFPHISISDILEGKAPETKFRDKIVLVGATATGIFDLRVTPFEEVFPGLETHANVIDMILRQDFLHKSILVATADVFIILFFGLFLGFLLPRVGSIAGAAATLFLFFGYLYLCLFLFSHAGVILAMIYPLFVILTVFIVITVYKYFTESKQKNFIKGAFSTYLAPSVVNQLIDNPEKLVLGGEERTITAFFSDVQGFTSISEKLVPNELVDLLNEFLTEMTEIILRHQGTVDKFEGDAIIAMFGAPIDLENQAKAACRASVDMQRRLAELRTQWREQNRPELKMRIGLYTGKATVGNMGSKNRMDYTMMGDTVNTAARLEGVNKVYGTYTMIGESTHSEAIAGDDTFLTRELDRILVVGKKEPLKIYEIIGLKEEAGPMREIVEIYAEGMKHYRNGEWEAAIRLFDEILKQFPDDGPSIAMRQRCRDYMGMPPEHGWDIFQMKTK